MFDPTIYENLKVVLEGAVYDLDLSNEISVINRSDIVDLATMSRSYSVKFKLPDQRYNYPYAAFTLYSSLNDFALEKIEEDEKKAGCTLELNYYTKIKTPDHDCNEIHEYISKAWDNRPIVHQEISYSFGKESGLFNKVTLDFARKINEDQIDDLHLMIEYMIKPLKFLQKMYD